MKKLALLFTLSALLVTSCIPQDQGDDTYTNVYAGIQIYDAATTTYNLALDAPEAAFRLGILLAEMEAQGIEMADGEPQDWSQLKDFKFSYDKITYNLKEFLFGIDDSVKLERKGDTYYLTFGNDKFQFGYGIFDHYTRSGTFIIETHGLALTETTANEPWRISVGEKGMAYGGTSSTTKQCNSNVWYEGDGNFGLVTPQFESYYDASPTITSSWISLINIEISDFTSLSLDDLEGASYTVTIDPMTGGDSMTGLKMSFATGGVINKEITPLLYKPSTNALNPISGAEEVKLTGKYNEYMFPSPFVKVEWTSGVATVYYNDFIYNTAI